MTSRVISGNALRDKLLARIREGRVPTDIQALASAGNRELLEIIATKHPHSISELAGLAGRLQPNVSRSMTMLVQSGLVELIPDGRASVPTLTELGLRRARELGISGRAGLETISSSTEGQIPDLLSLNLPASPTDDLASDVVNGDVMISRSKSGDATPVVACTHADLNEVCIRVLTNWWRILSRRDDPFRIFPIGAITRVQDAEGTLSARSTGDRIQIVVRPIGNNSGEELCPSFEEFAIFLAQKIFADAMLTDLVLPVIKWLHAGRRFDRPIEWMLRRIEESSQHPNDIEFCRTAGALGKSPYDLDNRSAEEVRNLIAAIPDDDARLDFASAIVPAHADKVLRLVGEEIERKADTNRLQYLPEFRKMVSSKNLRNAKPYQVGIALARSVRQNIKLAEDESVGGIKGLLGIFGGGSRYCPSQLECEQIRGFLARGDGIPVVIVHSEGKQSTSFLVARAIGDYLAFGSREAPIADIYTDRQAVGRAFAAELLAPSAGVIRMVDEENLPVASVANHYDVRNDVIQWQYNNNVRRHALA